MSLNRNPSIDMISHPDDGRCPLDYPVLAEEAVRHRALLEINNNAMRLTNRLNVEENILTILALCKEKLHPIVLSSDAHYMNDVGNLDHVLPLLERVNFPEELIFNAHPEEFLSWLEENRRLEGKEHNTALTLSREELADLKEFNQNILTQKG